MENGATGISQGFHFAAQKSKLDILKYLLEKGADIYSEQKYDGSTALHIACKYDSLDVVIFLAEKYDDLVKTTIINFKLNIPKATQFIEFQDSIIK